MESATVSVTSHVFIEKVVAGYAAVLALYGPPCHA
jgi:hypothetical protein